MSRQSLGRIGLILTAIVWGSGFAMTDVAMQVFSAHQLIVLRFGIAFLLMAVISAKHLKTITKATLFKGATMGIILYLAYVLQTVALVYTTPSKNAFLSSFYIILVPFVSVTFFKSRVQIKDITGAVCSIFGIAVMSLTDFSNINFGDILTLCCALFYALHIIYTDNFVKNENVLVLNTIQIGTVFLCSGVVLFFRGEQWDFSNSIANGSILYLAVICTMLAFLLQTIGQKYTKRTETAIILSMESVFGMIFSILIVQEQITTRTLIGAFFILLGVLIVELLPSKKEPRVIDI